MDLREVKRLQRDKSVFNGIVQVPIFALAAGGMSLPWVRMILRIAVTVFQRKPPS
jgi:hypothetical protein